MNAVDPLMLRHVVITTLEKIYDFDPIEATRLHDLVVAGGVEVLPIREAPEMAIIVVRSTREPLVQVAREFIEPHGDGPSSAGGTSHVDSWEDE